MSAETIATIALCFSLCANGTALRAAIGVMRLERDRHSRPQREVPRSVSPPPWRDS